MSHYAENDTSIKYKTNTVIFKLEDDVLVVCNNGEPFSIEGIESLMLPHYTSKSKREFKQSFKSTVINKQVEELLEKRRENYLREPERIQSDYTAERTTVGEYHGREILELLQNCIDAMPDDNTQPDDTVFQIGTKGLGFRSLLNWCERIMIYSADLSVAFGLEEASAFKDSLGRNQKVAIFSAPTPIEPIELSYTTQIVLKLKKSVIGDVEAQLMQIDERSMVFLPKIEELVIQTAASERSYQKLEIDGDVLISASVDGVSTDYLWRVFKQERKTVIFDDTDNEEKQYSYGISIAFCESSPNLGNNYLYSYFKTKVEFPIGWLCHADFELRSDRNDIIDHPLNKLILQELVSLIDSSTEKIANNGGKPENALRSIVPKGSFPADIAGFKFSEYYHANIGRKKILPTVNGDFISITESPWIANGVFPALFIGDAFKKLLKTSDSADIVPFIHKIAQRDNINVKITLNEIKSAINQVSDEWSPSECFTVFEWWRKAYGADANALDFLPNLIALDSGKWADGKDRVYFKVGGVPAVPAWVRFSFLRADFQEAAVAFYNNEEGYLVQKAGQTEQRDERNIPVYATIGINTFFRYLDRSTTIAQVNSSVDENWSYAQDFVSWLYENYGNNPDWTPPAEVSYNFPSKNKAVTRPETLYFGEYYGNELADILAMQDGQDELYHFPFASKVKEDFINFVSKFGVCITPIPERPLLRNWQIPKSYREALISNITYPLQLDGGTVIADESAMRNESELVSITFDSYKNLDDILSKAETPDLLTWIAKDNFLKNSLMVKYEKGITYPLSAKRKGQINGRWVQREQVRNYIAHTFSHTAWIQIGEKRYSPNQIILDEKIGMQFEPRLIGKSSDFIFDGLLLEEYELNAIINNLGFISDFTKIDPSFLYVILNELSENNVDPNGELSRKIYLQIMKASGLTDPDTTCIERIKFFRNGKVYCFDGQFRRARDVRYADKSFPDRVRANHHLIDLPKNRGAKKAEMWFGTKEFKPDITVRSFVKSVFNQQFQEEFHELLKGLYVENNQNITDEKRWRSVKNMRITLASSGIMTSGETQWPCENYEYGKETTEQTKNSYVLVIGSNALDKFDERLTNTLFEIIRAVINIDDPALASSFRDLWKFPSVVLRKALIQRNEDENIWDEADLFFDGIAMPFKEEDTEAKNRALFIKCRDDNLDKFKRILYAKMSASTVDEQKTFLTEIGRYKRIEPVQTTLQDEFCNVLLLLQSISPANLLTEDDNDIGIDAIGKTTKQKLYEAFPQHRGELNGFLTIEYDSLLRFGNYDLIKTEFEKHLQKQQEAEEAAIAATTTLKQPVVDNSPTRRLAPPPPKVLKNEGTPNGGGGYTDYSSRQTQNTNIGKLAERIVYDHLVDEHGDKNVLWVSQFAKEENVNLDGSDKYGYDIEYYVGGIKHYVEVKTNSSSLPTVAFNLPTSEREFAETHDNYQICVVTAPRTDSPRITFYPWMDVKGFANTPTGYWVEFNQQEAIT